MSSMSRSLVTVALFLLVGSFALAASVPIVVYPNPAQFGTVAEFSTGYLTVYVTNTSATSVIVTSVTISGTNSADFAFNGPNCVGTLAASQTCQMAILFTPSTIGSLSANLVVTVQGLTQHVNVPLQGTGGNPLPTITSLSPASAYVNSAAFTLTVNGTAFVPGAAIYFANTALATTYISSSQLTAEVPASFLTGTGSDWVQVVNPGGGYSGLVYFSVVALDPNLSNASPTSVVAGTLPTAIVLTGNNFMDGATVQWNGKPVPTTYMSSSQLQFTPTKGGLGSASIVQLSVSNPPPGGISAPINFDVTYSAKVTILDLSANSLVWDPYAQRIYATVPSSYGSNGNSIAVINPTTGKITGYNFAGSEPSALALSSDSLYLYAGLNGNGSVQRFVLPKFTPDITSVWAPAYMAA